MKSVVICRGHVAEGLSAVIGEEFVSLTVPPHN